MEEKWKNEIWARNVARLDEGERARRIGAASVLLESSDDISDALYSELVILLEALRPVSE